MNSTNRWCAHRLVVVIACGAWSACGTSSPVRGRDARTDGTLDAVDVSMADVTDGADAASLPRCPGPFHPPSPAELSARRALGVPDEAACAVVLAQTSHLDIDWQYTFDAYYTMWVEGIFSAAASLLASDPAYRYQVCEMGYLEHHLAQHPEQIATMRAAVARGALHIVGGGITSPDTLLPTSEALVRDYLRGSVFAETTLGARAHTAWLPDSFGHAPTVPDLLAGMGYDAVAFSRVDGFHDFVEAIHGQPTIVAGSTAALLRDMQTTDFMWVGPGGGQVLAHWMPVRLYCQGDTIDHTGTPVPGSFIAGDDRADDVAYTNAQIAGFVSELTPYARTPYLFVPIGCDFQAPKPRLTEYVQRWNGMMYPSTGIYAVAATFDDYTLLLADRHADLPTFARDIAPYFSGYLGSRLAVKAGARAVGERLGQAEIVALLAQTLGGAPYPATDLAAAWDLFSRTNHHDFIAGTAVDAVTLGEQIPLLDGLGGTVDAIVANALDGVSRRVASDPAAVASAVVVGTTGAPGPREALVSVALPAGVARDLAASVPSQVLSATRASDGTLTQAQVLLAIPSVAPLSYQRVSFHAGTATGPLQVTDDGTTVTLADTSTGLVAAIDRATGELHSLRAGGMEWLSAPSLQVDAWTDQGGLYRIGSESGRCTFTPAGTRGGVATVTVLEPGPARARVSIVRPGGVTLELRMTAGLPRLDIDVNAAAMPGQTLTLRVSSVVASASATFVHAAGEVIRASEHLYTPTFWPVVRGVDLRNVDGSGFAILPATSTGVHYDSAGRADVMVSRDAMSEACDALGAAGSEDVHRTVSFALRPHRTPIDVLAEDMALNAAPAVQLTASLGTAPPTGALVMLGGSGFVVSAAKPADRGGGVIVRFERTGGHDAALAPALLTASTLVRTDLLERDGATVSSPIPLDARLVTVRLVP